VTTAPVTDGRNARSQRTRLAVVDALLDLLRDGNPRPTAKEIAERAGVSLRSVYVHFDDREDLFLSAAVRQGELISGLLTEIPTDGPLRARAELLMQVRGRLYEVMEPMRRAVELQEPSSPALSAVTARNHRRLRREVARVFALELGGFPDDVRARRHAALDALTSPAAWRHLRTASELDEGAARETAIEAMIALLENRG
jgi:AcrR family transcriptional regulator